jgi:membrane protein insertase Oxa1/YidC/SpoIIIJ
VATYFQSTQLMPQDKNQRKLRDILKSAGEGKQADQAEVNAAVGQSTKYLLPAMIFVFTINLPAALSLYWLTGGIVAYIQQSIILGRDEEEMEELAGKPSKNVSAIPEAEIVTTPAKTTSSKPKKKPRSKRRKK